jgi:hypothetical protein
MTRNWKAVCISKALLLLLLRLLLPSSSSSSSSFFFFFFFFCFFFFYVVDFFYFLLLLLLSLLGDTLDAFAFGQSLVDTLPSLLLLGLDDRYARNLAYLQATGFRFHGHQEVG